jgi:hypothetical protein
MRPHAPSLALILGSVSLVQVRRSLMKTTQCHIAYFLSGSRLRPASAGSRQQQRESCRWLHEHVQPPRRRRRPNRHRNSTADDHSWSWRRRGCRYECDGRSHGDGHGRRIHCHCLPRQRQWSCGWGFEWRIGFSHVRRSSRFGRFGGITGYSRCQWRNRCHRRSGAGGGPEDEPGRKSASGFPGNRFSDKRF